MRVMDDIRVNPTPPHSHIVRERQLRYKQLRLDVFLIEFIMLSFFKRAFFSIGRFFRFFFNFITKPGTTGAIAPSSEKLAERMTEWIEWENVKTVVEYGPGTGAFTGAILANMKPGTCYFAIEVNEEMIKTLAKRYPHVKVYRESVENVQQLCEQEGVSQIDAVISGLPWAIFSSELQQKFMDATLSVLRPGGQFVTFAYLHGLPMSAGKKFKERLDTNFSECKRSKVVWMNVPPALVYRCRR